MRTWRYVAARKAISGEHSWQVHEYYGDSWTVEPVSAYGETLDDMRRDLMRMIADTENGWLDLDTGEFHGGFSGR